MPKTDAKKRITTDNCKTLGLCSFNDFLEIMHITRPNKNNVVSTHINPLIFQQIANTINSLPKALKENCSIQITITNTNDASVLFLGIGNDNVGFIVSPIIEGSGDLDDEANQK